MELNENARRNEASVIPKHNCN